MTHNNNCNAIQKVIVFLVMSSSSRVTRASKRAEKNKSKNDEPTANASTLKCIDESLAKLDNICPDDCDQEPSEPLLLLGAVPDQTIHDKPAEADATAPDSSPGATSAKADEKQPCAEESGAPVEERAYEEYST